MQSDRINSLKAFYRFDRWSRAGEGQERLFVRHFRLGGNELPARSIVRNRVAALSGAKLLNTSTWQKPDTPVEPPVLVDAFEHLSRQKAYESLIELAGEFHLPVALDFETEDVGDVRLATRNGGWFAFARGNLVVRVMSGDSRPAPARAMAEGVDRSLVSKPPGAVEDTGASLEDMLRHKIPGRPGAARFSPKGPAEAPGPPEGQAYVKVFSRGGDVEFDDGYVLVPQAPEVELEVFVIDPAGPSTFQRYRGPA